MRIVPSWRGRVRVCSKSALRAYTGEATVVLAQSIRLTCSKTNLCKLRDDNMPRQDFSSWERVDPSRA